MRVAATRSRHGGSPSKLVISPDYQVKLPSGEIHVHFRLGGRTVAIGEGSTLRYLLADHLNSTHAELTAQGAEETQRRYGPWGSDRAVSGAADLVNNERYTGQYRVDEGGGNARRELYHYGARAYLPGVGLFTQPDTIVPNPKNPQALNRYAYVYNNPIRLVDPSGHCAITNGWTGDAAQDLNCTVDEFNSVWWYNRIGWLVVFQELFETGGWFNVWYGVFQGFAESAHLQNSETLLYADAVLLWSVQEGKAVQLRLRNMPSVTESGYRSVEAWRGFFEGQNPRDPGRREGEVRLRMRWAVAEQIGVEHGLSEAVGKGKLPGSWEEWQLLRDFYAYSTTYRHAMWLNAPIVPDSAPRIGLRSPDSRYDAQFALNQIRAIERALVINYG